MVGFDLTMLCDECAEDPDKPQYCTQASRDGLHMIVEGVGESPYLVDNLLPATT